ncbi:hypothetical protein [Rhodoplanes sp. Z2-YC6860]|uniref:hypothetical protein n=1 Tax=Rhodoplanes sp. Z2-YC6860 TaxID=674703 RepID=UPI00078CAE30|nr:hypothetical protein [Rhodoplanes sp. Z2-YC6860]AMN44890.1 hypothetical protein RHPLAN_64840 [Rhodoplanes sp. Z2-YC6860]
MSRRWMAVMAASVLLTAASQVVRAEETKAQPKPDEAFANKLYATDVTQQKKTFACFVREYDRNHLARHHAQKVTAMKLLVTAERDPEDGVLNHSFSLGVKLRNRPENFSSGGGCGHAKMSEGENGQEHLGCNVDCEGGGVDVELSADAKSTIVRVGSVRIWNYKKPSEEGFYLEGGADDRVFRLDRAPLEMCKSLAEDRDELAEMMAQAKKRVSAVR